MLKGIIQWIQDHPGLFTGIVIGLAVAILFLTIGFGATLLILVCVGVGAFLGANPQIRQKIGAAFMSLFDRKK